MKRYHNDKLSLTLAFLMRFALFSTAAIFILLIGFIAIKGVG